MWFLAILTVLVVLIVQKAFDGLQTVLEILGLGEIAFFGIILGIGVQVVAMSFDRAQTRVKTWK